MKLLTRDTFRESVLKRDGKCVICGSTGKLDAHHIIERRLFDHPEEHGGYFLENGASLCDDGTLQSCHLKAEATILSCEEIREAAGITKIVLPRNFYTDQRYDKWGNPYLSNGSRAKGPLFFDESVQKILEAGGVLGQFVDRVKHPRTSHLPWSGGATDDDEFVPSLDLLKQSKVIVTVKLDGEQTTMYSDYMHARSLDGRHDPSQSWVRNLHASIKYNIPPGWRVCGENMFEKHTIPYHLSTYFYVHSIWNERNICLSWQNTVDFAALLELEVVPYLWRGHFEEKAIHRVYTPIFEGNPMEGYVVRVEQEFSLAQFPIAIGKYVSPQFARNRDARHGERIRERNILID